MKLGSLEYSVSMEANSKQVEKRIEKLTALSQNLEKSMGKVLQEALQFSAVLEKIQNSTLNIDIVYTQISKKKSIWERFKLNIFKKIDNL